MTDRDRRILASLWLPPARQRLVAADMGMTAPAMARRGLVLLTDPSVERDEPVLVHQARRVMNARERARRGRR